MGIVRGGIQFTGSIQGLSAYTMRGSDKLILRTKGGASKEHIKNKPKFEKTRQLNNEWKGVTMAALAIRVGLYALKPLADYNVSGPLNALVKKIQTLDTLNPKGKRSILFSKQPDIFGSFSFNRQNFFDTIIREPLQVSVDKTTFTAEISIPNFYPAINFFPHPGFSFFRLIICPVCLSDYIATEGVFAYSKADKNPEYKPQFTSWAQTNIPQPSADYQVAPNSLFLANPNLTFMIGIGIQYGIPGIDGSIQPAPYVGAARILKSV